MAKSPTKTISFRISLSEAGRVGRIAGGISIGEFARRMVLNAEPDARRDQRRAIGKTIRAIHSAISLGLQEEVQKEVIGLLGEALELVEREPDYDLIDDGSEP